MNRDELIKFISARLPIKLTEEFVDAFLQIRQDALTQTLGRSAPGKFIETFVQILQYLERGDYDSNPKVDEYLKVLESRHYVLDNGLRICASRVARASYSLRSKRSIAHKNDVDPNSYDLNFLLSSAQWIFTEIIRNLNKTTMEDAGYLITMIQTPLGGIVEDFGDKHLVLKNLKSKEEILLILYIHYPEYVNFDEIQKSMERRQKRTIKNSLGILWNKKKIDRINNSYKLTLNGYNDAIKLVKMHCE